MVTAYFPHASAKLFLVGKFAQQRVTTQMRSVVEGEIDAPGSPATKLLASE